MHSLRETSFAQPIIIMFVVVGVLNAAVGVLRQDWIIITANAVGASLSAIVLGCKLRDIIGKPRA